MGIEMRPTRPRTELGYLLVSIVALTVAAVVGVVDHTTPVNMAPGSYAVLAAVAGATFVGWVVRSQARAVRRVEFVEPAEWQREREHYQDVIESMAADLEMAERRRKSDADIWWSGYAACLEDAAGGGSLAGVVVPMRRGDRSSDTGRRMNGSDMQ